MNQMLFLWGKYRKHFRNILLKNLIFFNKTLVTGLYPPQQTLFTLFLLLIIQTVPSTRDRLPPVSFIDIGYRLVVALVSSGLGVLT